MKLSLKILIGFFLILGNFYESFANVDFVVKKSTSHESTYSNNIIDVGIGSNIDLQATHIIGSPQTQVYKIFFPAGFQYVSYALSGTCEIFHISSQTHTLFEYSIGTSQPGCYGTLEIEYMVLSTVQIQNSISLANLSNQILLSASVGTTGNITLLSAQTLDRNQNGFIDGYRLEFSQNILDSSIDISGLLVGGSPATGWDTGNAINDTVIEIYFADNIFHTGETPQITKNIPGLAQFVGSINNDSVIEQDFSRPLITHFNGTLISGTDIIIGTGSLNFEFSEYMKHSFLSGISLQNSLSQIIPGNYSFSGKVVTFLPDNSLVPGLYSLNFDGNVVDASVQENLILPFEKNLRVTITRIMACSGIVSNASWNSVSSITQTWNGSIESPSSVGTYNTTPSTSQCRFVCNNGYSWNGSSCVSQSGGGGGGSGGGGGGISIIPQCTSQQLECKNGSYTIKQNEICSGGDFGKSCEITTPPIKDLWGDTFVEYISTENTSDDEDITFEKVQSYIEKYFSLNVQKNLKKYLPIFDISNKEYFLESNQNFAQQYRATLLAYKNLADSLHQYEKNKTKENFTHIQEKFRIFESRTLGLKNPILQFVEIKNRGSFEIYVTKNKQLQNAFAKIEKGLLNKFDKQLQANVLSDKQYRDIIYEYNSFVLYVSIYRWNRDKNIIPIIEANFIELKKTFQKKLPPKKVSPPLLGSTKKVQEVYFISNEQKVGNYNNDVKNIQLILRHYGYFEYEPTGYFGNTTQEKLKQFVEEKLNNPYPGFLSKNIINLIHNLSY